MNLPVRHLILSALLLATPASQAADSPWLSRLLLNTADVAIAAAEAGHGITRVLSYMIAPQVKEGRLEVLLADHEPPAVPVQIVHKEAGRTSARVRAVVDHLVQRLRRNAALQAASLA